MEATATAADFPRESRGFWERFRGGAKKAGAAIKRASVSVASAPKRMYRRAVGTKTRPHAARRGVRWVGRTIRKTLAYIGVGISAVIQIAIGVVVALIIALATAIFVVVTTVLGLVCGIVAGVYSMFRKLTLFFRWVASDEKIGFSDYLDTDRTETRTAWKQITDAVEGMIDEDEDDGEITVPSDFQNDRTLFGPYDQAKFARNVQVLREKAVLRTHADREPNAYPGALVALAGDEEDPYAADITTILPDNRILAIMGEWLENHPDRAAVDFSFKRYENYEELMEALLSLRDTSKGRVERSYWHGRIRALEYAHHHPQAIKEHGRAWALLYSELKGDQQTWALKYVRTGFMDMIQDLPIKKGSRGERPVSSV